MSMFAKENLNAVHALNVFNQNSNAMQNNMVKISTGSKINDSKDDAANYAISERMRIRIRALEQSTQNIQNDSSLVKTADTAVNSTIEILRTLKEKAINAANDSNTDADRAIIQKEFNRFIDQIDDNAHVQFNGKYLIDGSKNNAIIDTKTVLLNQDLAIETFDKTKLTDLKNRAGKSLGIQETDTFQLSWVQNGQNYSASGEVLGLTLSLMMNCIRKDEYADIDGELINTFYRGQLGNNGGVWLSSKVSGGYTTFFENHILVAETPADGEEFPILDKYIGMLGKTADEIEELKAEDSSNPGHGETIEIFDIYNEDTGACLFYVANLTDSVLPSMDSAEGYVTWDIENSKWIFTAGSNTDKAGTLLYFITADPLILDKFEDEVYTFNNQEGIGFASKIGGVDNQISGLTINIVDKDGNDRKTANAALNQFKQFQRAENATGDCSLNFQTGSEANQSIKLGLTDMRTYALGLTGRQDKKLNIETKETANAAINVIENALTKALDQQTALGAVESRLEHNLTNLMTSIENVRASESVIRDADMAKEMTSYTKNKVLLHASQVMLAHANQNGAAVLALLR
ncbi:MAG: hypothetical protein K6G55_00035 [Selenomonadaceae bacterium]|nr:hypothetical protein [Selenomonadaceae bacterium]